MAMTFSHLHIICMESEEPEPWCLLNAALTCKDFLEVRLDALWEELVSLVPLLKLLPALQIEDGAFVCHDANVHVFINDLIRLAFRYSMGMYLRRIGIGYNITLKKSSLSYFSIRNSRPRFILRLIFKLLNFFSQLFSFHHFVTLSSTMGT